MPVKEADPAAKSLDAAFAEAMGALPKPKEPPAPKEIDPDAPHGRDDQGNALAPYGLTKEGRPRKSAAGRPSNDDRPRTGPSQPAAGGKGDAGKEPARLAEKGELSGPLSDAAEGLWFGLSALGKAAPGIPFIGKRLPAEKIQAQAAVWFATKDRAAAAVSLAAEHSAAAARFARRFEGGGNITWMITCLALVAPIVSLSGMVWAKDADAQLAAAGQPPVAELVKKNEAAMDAAIKAMTAQAAQLAEQEAAAVNGQVAA